MRFLALRLLLLILFSEYSYAESFYSLEQIINRIIKNNSALKSAYGQIRAREASKLQTGLYINPEIELIYLNAEENESEIGLTQEFELGAKRSWRVMIADKDIALAKLELADIKLKIINKAKRLYFEISNVQAKIEFFAEAVELAKKVLSSAKRRVRTGAAPNVEITRAELSLTAVNLNYIKLGRDLESKLTSLSALWGAEMVSFKVGRQKKIPKNIPSLQSLKEKFKQGENPKISIMKIIRIKQMSAIGLANANRIPNLTVGASFARNYDTDQNSLAFTVSLPLPLFNRNQGNMALRKIESNNAQLNYQSVSLELLEKLTLSYNAMRTSFDALKTYEKLILPNSLLAFKDIEKLYRLGTESYLSLLEAQKNLTEVKISQVDAKAEFFIQWSNIESILGESIL